MSIERARRAIESLIQLSPDVALVETPGGPISRPVEDVLPGDVVLVRPGERVPLDGTVLAGESSVDESTLTGESLPAHKSEGAAVFAGTLNRQGHLTVRVEKRSEDSALAHIIHLVEEAQQQKAPSQQFVERFARAARSVLSKPRLAARSEPRASGDRTVADTQGKQEAVRAGRAGV